MNKSALKKCSWSHVRLRPIAKRFYGANGPQLPPVDDDWLIHEVGDVVRISNTATGHGTVLGLDQIHHYSTDPPRGERIGFLTLNVQVHIGGNALWTEPTFRPGEALPDQFANVRNWDRANDSAYIERLFPSAATVATAAPATNVNPVLQGVFLACVAVGACFLIAKT